jgi:hypothetical protein
MVDRFLLFSGSFLTVAKKSKSFSALRYHHSITIKKAKKSHGEIRNAFDATP